MIMDTFYNYQIETVLQLELKLSYIIYLNIKYLKRKLKQDKNQTYKEGKLIKKNEKQKIDNKNFR